MQSAVFVNDEKQQTLYSVIYFTKLGLRVMPPETEGMWHSLIQSKSKKHVSMTVK